MEYTMKKMESDQYIHPECNLPFMRGRGIMWWTMSQDVLEAKSAQGDIVLTEGTCYMFLEEEFTKKDKKRQDQRVSVRQRVHGRPLDHAKSGVPQRSSRRECSAVSHGINML